MVNQSNVPLLLNLYVYMYINRCRGFPCLIHNQKLSYFLTTKETNYIMARKPRYDLLIIIIIHDVAIFLCFALLLLTSIQARTLNNLPVDHQQRYHPRDLGETKSTHSQGAVDNLRRDVLLIFQAMKHSGPSPGIGNSFTTGSRN